MKNEHDDYETLDWYKHYVEYKDGQIVKHLVVYDPKDEGDKRK
jgi:uncharacterized protein YprB with RNaseH-like and TPR domain